MLRNNSWRRNSARDGRSGKLPRTIASRLNSSKRKTTAYGTIEAVLVLTVRFALPGFTLHCRLSADTIPSVCLQGNAARRKLGIRISKSSSSESTGIDNAVLSCVHLLRRVILYPCQYLQSVPFPAEISPLIHEIRNTVSSACMTSCEEARLASRCEATTTSRDVPTSSEAVKHFVPSDWPARSMAG